MVPAAHLDQRGRLLGVGSPPRSAAAAPPPFRPPTRTWTSAIASSAWTPACRLVGGELAARSSAAPRPGDAGHQRPARDRRRGVARLPLASTSRRDAARQGGRRNAARRLSVEPLPLRLVATAADRPPPRASSAPTRAARSPAGPSPPRLVDAFGVHAERRSPDLPAAAHGPALSSMTGDGRRAELARATRHRTRDRRHDDASEVPIARACLAVELRRRALEARRGRLPGRRRPRPRRSPASLIAELEVLGLVGEQSPTAVRSRSATSRRIDGRRRAALRHRKRAPAPAS